MATFKVELDGQLDAADPAEAARKVAAHFAAVAEAWDAEEVDWDAVPSTFSVARLDIRPI